MSPLEVHDPGLHDLIASDAAIERIAGGLTFTEGPVWRGTHLLFSDIPNKRIVRWRRLPEGPELTTFATGMSNGLTLDRQGRVLAAEHDGRRVTRVADDGARTVLAEHFQGKRLNSPNDIVVKSDGSIYFTDPPYAVQPSRPGVVRPPGWWTQPIPGKEQPCHGVYRLAPDGILHLLVDDFALPNGLAFSPDESILYVGDSGANHEPGSFDPRRPHHVRAFDVVEGRRLENGRLFATITPGFPDGLKVDADGRVYSSSFSGVQIFSPDGELLDEINLPGAVNFAFAGSTLLITTDNAIWAAQLSAKGA